MSDIGGCFAIAAESFVGAPFRLRGRNPATGLDCVGLVACALDRIGQTPHDLPRYGLRNASIAAHLAFAARNGFGEASGAILAGDLLLTEPGAGQHHLLIAAGNNMSVHAHAGLRRVVHGPLPRDWPLVRHWRLRNQTSD